MRCLNSLGLPQPQLVEEGREVYFFKGATELQEQDWAMAHVWLPVENVEGTGGRPPDPFRSAARLARAIEFDPTSRGRGVDNQVQEVLYTSRVDFSDLESMLTSISPVSHCDPA